MILSKSINIILADNLGQKISNPIFAIIHSADISRELLTEINHKVSQLTNNEVGDIYYLINSVISQTLRRNKIFDK
jgi:S-adenosylmethionine synthetase